MTGALPVLPARPRDQRAIRTATRDGGRAGLDVADRGFPSSTIRRPLHRRLLRHREPAVPLRRDDATFSGTTLPTAARRRRDADVQQLLADVRGHRRRPRMVRDPLPVRGHGVREDRAPGRPLGQPARLPLTPERALALCAPGRARGSTSWNGHVDRSTTSVELRHRQRRDHRDRHGGAGEYAEPRAAALSIEAQAIAAARGRGRRFQATAAPRERLWRMAARGVESHRTGSAAVRGRARVNR